MSAGERIALVTGANSGIGKETARALANGGYRVFLACRSADSAARTRDELNLTAPVPAEVLSLDLTSLDSVRSCAAEFLALNIPLHVLVNNAGVVARGLTQDGFELIFGVNHLGHFLLTTLLLERIKSSAPARIVNVSSKSHYGAKRIDFERLRRPTSSITGLPEYEVSKACNVLFTRSLATRLEGTSVTSYAVHPGQVATNVWRRVPWPISALMKSWMLTAEQGAEGVIRAAMDPAMAAETGRYYDKTRVAEPSKLSQDDGLAEELWQRSAAWTAATET